MLATAALTALPGSALSHQSGAQVLAMSVAARRIHLSIQRGGSRRAPGSVLHQTTLDPCDIVHRRGFRVTTPERTLVDLGATLGRDELQRVIEEQLIKRATTFDRVEQTFVRVAAGGRTGIARTRAVLAALDGKPPNESELEARFQRLLDRRRLPVPIRQATLQWSSTEKGRVDCWYPEAKLIIELDGRTFHARLAAFERDRRRDQLALVNDLRTVRFTHHQITDDPADVAAVVRALLGIDQRPNRGNK